MVGLVPIYFYSVGLRRRRTYKRCGKICYAHLRKTNDVPYFFIPPRATVFRPR